MKKEAPKKPEWLKERDREYNHKLRTHVLASGRKILGNILTRDMSLRSPLT